MCVCVCVYVCVCVCVCVTYNIYNHPDMNLYVLNIYD